MTNEEFGKMVHQHCHVAEVRQKILESARMRQPLSEAELGFVAAIRNQACKSGVDQKFLAVIAQLDAEGAALEELEHRREQHECRRGWPRPENNKPLTGVV